MKKYAKIVNEETKACEVGLGTNAKYYKSIGMVEMEVELGYDGFWYLAGYATVKPKPTYTELRQKEYPPIEEQLDILYWDKVNGTNNWADLITKIKEKYPKPVEPVEESEVIEDGLQREETEVIY